MATLGCLMQWIRIYGFIGICKLLSAKSNSLEIDEGIESLRENINSNNNETAKSETSGDTKGNQKAASQTTDTQRSTALRSAGQSSQDGDIPTGSSLSRGKMQKCRIIHSRKFRY